MADVTILRAAVPALPKNQGLWVETAVVADGDDLVLGEIEQPPERLIYTAPAVAVTSLATISDGVYPGQRVKLAVSNANTLRVPAALGNVDAGANIDAVRDAPVELTWLGAAWIQST